MGDIILMIKKIKRLYNRRKAISPVIATILLIALTVVAAAIVYFVVVPIFNTNKLDASVVKIYDTNRDSLYNQVEIQFVNTGTKTINITKVTIWTCAQSEIDNEDLWFKHEGWMFDNQADSIIQPSEIDSVKISGDSQIVLSIYEITYSRLEIEYTGMKYVYLTEWMRVSEEFLDLSDILSGFESFNLTAAGFEGTIDDINNPYNNYLTSGGDYILNRGMINMLPVLNETDIIPFLVTDSIVVFHTPFGTLGGQPLQQKLDLSSTPIRAKKFFVLGLAGSWGDEFTSGDWALNVTFEYTDGSYVEFLLDHDYIDDWYYESNPGNTCISAPGGKITEIDLGMQTNDPTPHHIHTHTTRFYFDYFKYLKAIIFTDPGNDNSAPHLISLTLG